MRKKYTKVEIFQHMDNTALFLYFQGVINSY